MELHKENSRKPLWYLNCDKSKAELLLHLLELLHHEFEDFINNFVNIYRTLSEIPTLNCAQVIDRNSNLHFIKVESVWSQKNIEQGEVTKFQKNFVVKASSCDIIFESTPTDISAQELSKISNSEKFRCVVRKTKQDNKKKQFLEIWSANGLFKNFDVAAFDIHGDIYCDGEFGTLEWSPDEEKVLYLAEMKSKKYQPFYRQRAADAKKLDDEKASVTGDEYNYKPDWGEQLVDKHQPVVGICHIKTETLKVLEGIPPNFSPGQLLWSKDGSGVFGIALENEPRRLGLVYCTNRLSYVFHVTLNGEFKILSEANKSVRSPRLSLDGSSLFWLQRPVGSVHNGCQELVKLNLATNEREVLIEIVRHGEDIFSGLYLHNLPVRCFSKDGNKLFFSSCNKLKNSSYYLDMVTKKVHLLETGEGSATVLDVHDDIILISTGSLQRAPAIKMSLSVSDIYWIPITKSEVICHNSVLEELEFDTKISSDKFTYYNALYYGPSVLNNSEQKIPLIVCPHGGPHSAIINDYAFEPNFFVRIGYGVLMVNYRGSTGVGQDGIDFLQGKISDTDVKDCHEAVLYALENIPHLDENNVFLYGRSHGGYLVLHLSAQYPDFYRAVVSGNPVTDVLAMYVMSDIPDWATGECGLAFDESKPLTMEQIGKIVASSPIQLLHKIKAPTLFLVGKKDLRVPHYQGIKMYNALKARKVKARLNLYDDNHTLGNVTNHIDCLINTALWFLENKA